MEATPLCRLVGLELPPRAAQDNVADLDRLRRGLRARLPEGRLELPFPRWGEFAHALREHGWRVDVLVDETAPPEPGLPPTHTVSAVFPAGRGPAPLPGLAVDLGTTTLVAELVDLSNGASLGQTSLTNPQAALGADVLTRVHLDRAGRGEELTRLIRRGVMTAAAELTAPLGLRTADIQAVAVAGNTIMTHFFLGLDTSRVIREPYPPVVNRPGTVTAGRLGLDFRPEGPVFVFPNAGAYFGGDLMAGMVATGMARSDAPRLLVDVGTNAEVVLGNRDWLVATAGAAGPALEGGVARFGMPAGPGAVTRVRVNPRTLEPTLEVMGGGPPLGLCGSGLIDLAAQLYLAGVIGRQGRIVEADHPRLAVGEDGPAYLLADGRRSGGRTLAFSQVDLDVFLRSKAAMYAILDTLFEHVGLEFGDVEKIYVAGTFGLHIDPRHAVILGMVPDLPLDRYATAGNTSLTGARLGLTSREARLEAADLRDRVTYLEMNVNQAFMGRFSAAKFLPHTDLGRFPGVPPPADGRDWRPADGLTMEGD